MTRGVLNRESVGATGLEEQDLALLGEQVAEHIDRDGKDHSAEQV